MLVSVHVYFRTRCEQSLYPANSALVDRRTDVLLCDRSNDAAIRLIEPMLDFNAGEKSHLISADLHLQHGSKGVDKAICFSPPGVKHKQCRWSPVRARDLASGRLLNGRGQTVGAGEQTEQSHQKAEGVNRGWTTDGEVRQSGHFFNWKVLDDYLLFWNY